MLRKLFAVTAIVVLAAPAFAQNAVTKPSPNEKQLDWKQHGLDAGHIGMERGPTDTKLTSTDVGPILGKTLLDNAGQSVGIITAVQNNNAGQPYLVHVQMGKEPKSPIRKVPAETINLRNGRVVTSLSVADVNTLHQ